MDEIGSLILCSQTGQWHKTSECVPTLVYPRALQYSSCIMHTLNESMGQKRFMLIHHVVKWKIVNVKQ